MKKINLFVSLLFLTCGIFAGTVVPMPDLQYPQEIIIDRGNLVITELPEIFVYSLKDFKLKAKFGKLGEGPGEFQHYVFVAAWPKKAGHLVVSSHLKAAFYTHEGKFVNEKRSSDPSVMNCFFKPVGDNYVSYGAFKENNIQYYSVNMYDPELTKIKRIFKWKNPAVRGKPFDPTDFDLRGGEVEVYGDKIFMLVRKKGNIEVFDKSGEKLFSINYAYEPVPITTGDKEKFTDYYKNGPRYKRIWHILKGRLQYPEYFPAARKMVVADNKIFILTHKSKDGKSEFIVFDLNGKFVEKRMVPIVNQNPRMPYAFTIHGGKLYQTVEDIEKEEWFLHIHSIQ